MESRTLEKRTAGTLSVRVHETMDGSTAEVIRLFLHSRQGPWLSHDPAWSSIFSRGLGHRPYYLQAQRDGQTVGVLPLAYVRSFLFGRYLVSLPYLNYGGPIVDEPATAAVLIDHAVRLADTLDVRYLELRNQDEIAHPSLTEKKTSKVLMWRELPATADELWKSFKPEVRNQIRKGEKSNLRVAWGTHDMLADFYQVFSRNMRDLGTPVFGKGLFSSILADLSGRSELCVVYLETLPIAGALLLHGAGFTEVPSASSLREHNKSCANMLMYHHLLLRAQDRGQRFFDFGRSSEDSGTYKFKRQWRAEPHPSVWQYYVRQGSISEVRPDNPKYQRKIETWKKLPLWLTRLLGPSIVRGIP